MDRRLFTSLAVIGGFGCINKINSKEVENFYIGQTDSDGFIAISKTKKIKAFCFQDNEDDCTSFVVEFEKGSVVVPALSMKNGQVISCSNDGDLLFDKHRFLDVYTINDLAKKIESDKVYLLLCKNSDGTIRKFNVVDFNSEKRDLKYFCK